MKNLIAAASLLALAGSALAKDLPAPSIAYIPGPEVVGVDTVSLTEDFEALALGGIAGQAGWGAFGSNASATNVSDLTPAGGSQHLRLTQGPDDPGTFNGAFSPDLGPLNNKSSIVSVDVRMDTINGSDAIVVGQAPSQGFLTWRVQLNFGGNILVLDDIGAGLQFVDTGVAWTPNAYENLTVEMDVNAGTIDYSYAGAPLYSSVAGVFAATSVEQVILFSDNFFNDDSESISFDNLSVIPTPGALALFGIAGLAAARRRR